MIAPPRSRWRSAVPDAIPARVTGTEPVSECDAGVPARPTPAPMKMYATAICQYGDALVPEEQHPQECGEQEHVAEEQREAGTARLDELRRPRRDDDHHQSRGENRRSRLERRVAVDVLEVLLAHEHGSHQRAEHDDAGAGRDPEDAATGDVQVVQGILRTALAKEERTERGGRDHREAEHERSLIRDGYEVDREDERADQHDGENPAEIVDRIRSSRSRGSARTGTP